MLLPLKDFSDAELRERLESAWRSHRALSFPKNCYIRINNHDLVLLEAGVVGYISTFLKTGTLDLTGVARLGLCYHDLREMFDVMDREANRYFGLLHICAGLTLRLLARQERGIDDER